MNNPTAAVKRVHVSAWIPQALGIINITSAERVRSLSELIPAELIHKALALNYTVTLRKRKLPLESMVWLVVGMAVFCNRPMTEIVNLMGITERTGAPFTFGYSAP